MLGLRIFSYSYKTCEDYQTVEVCLTEMITKQNISFLPSIQSKMTNDIVLSGEKYHYVRNKDNSEVTQYSVTIVSKKNVQGN